MGQATFGVAHSKATATSELGIEESQAMSCCMLQSYFKSAIAALPIAIVVSLSELLCHRCTEWMLLDTARNALKDTFGLDSCFIDRQSEDLTSNIFL